MRLRATATITDGREIYHIRHSPGEEETKEGMDASQLPGTLHHHTPRKYALNGLFAIDSPQRDADSTIS